ncbi:MAG: DUF1003 domain-containing protein [Myxococcales bacterium]|nr:MAG: DUF1003 domain-containing protein [Myxococcales bacterium]
MYKTTKPPEMVQCMICEQDKAKHRCAVPAALRPSLSEFMAERHSKDWNDRGYVCKSCLDNERQLHVLSQLEKERGQLSSMEAEVLRVATAHTSIAEHLDEQFETKLTVGQRVADRVARVGGSWPFVIAFSVCLSAWIALNTIVLRAEAFDPYPYILLNLGLSCLAAIQAPIIMMSQNRVSSRDRLEADADFRTNLKSEIEIAALHEKIDHLLHVQWEHMVEIQQTQLDLLSELRANRD